LRLNQIIIPAYVLNKLHWKHHVSEEEVHETLWSKPEVFFVEKGDVIGEDVYLALDRQTQAVILASFLSTKEIKMLL